MAGNKIHTKTKGKEDKNRNKSIVQENEETEDFDFSLLRKPILTSVTGFAQARKIFDLATEELKGLLTNECDLMYECKVCRNIFRSLANFISHKRIYCKEKFKTTQHGYFFKTNSVANEMLKIKKLEESYFESFKDKNGTEDIDLDEIDGRIPLTKDLTTIIEKIVRNKGLYDSKSDNQSVTLQKIPNSSVAVFQSVDNAEDKHDKMKAQVMELDTIMSNDKAVLQSDGNFKIQSSHSQETESVIQISDDDDDIPDDLKCRICEQKFSTLKTLKFHMKYKHLDSRLVYPCPDCLEIFSTSWSVYRHLFKVHRKSAAQIRRLRESIQAKAFKMNNPPAYYEKRKNMKPVPQKISEEERLDQENQAWLDNVEGDGSLPRCFGCGRTFERRAALAAHAHTCQPRSRARQPPRRPDAKKIEIQIRKDYNKGPPATTAPTATSATAVRTTEATLTLNTDTKLTSEEEPKTASKPEKEKEAEVKEPEKLVENDPLEVMGMDVSEDDDKSNDDPESPEKSTDATSEHPKTTLALKLPFAHQAEKSNLTAFRQRIRLDIEIDTLLCKKCDIQHNTVKELYDHMAEHYKWKRYACKLCNFKTYHFTKLPDHIREVHKLNGDTDFYFSTVKAIDGNEALQFSENIEESNESNDVSPGSRRHSRCSSDSSRLSDDSSSSSTRTELGSRKRKMFTSKSSAKRKKDASTNDGEEDRKANTTADKDSSAIDDTSSISKTFEENSSDMDDIEDKISKRQFNSSSSVATRRPVRKKTKRKNEDFEYDLSNLLKMEAQGYRDSLAAAPNTKSTQNKKKNTQPENQNYYDIVNRDCCGAMVAMAKKAVESSSAHIKNTSFTYVTQKDPRSSNIFVRPMIPKIVSRTEKNSPKKDTIEETKDAASPQPSPQKESLKDKNITPKVVNSENNSEKEQNKITPDANEDLPADQTTKINSTTGVSENGKTNLNIPAVLPLKFRRQSLDLIKNPIINKNITDFQKAGMKTKILVIKPINRNKDGKPLPNTPLKFQTIKLKEPSKSSSISEEKSDQVVVVKVPKVDTIARTTTDSSALSNEKSTLCNKEALNNNINNENDNEEEKNNEASEVDQVKNEEISIESNANNLNDSVAENPELVSDGNELIVGNEKIETIAEST